MDCVVFVLGRSNKAMVDELKNIICTSPRVSPQSKIESFGLFWSNLYFEHENKLKKVFNLL